ncbi:CidA/LrgA family protein [Propionivibrio limicola]|uniref:CidA/LrgA family protein n=1 Tax=Propionivibrio limicola TaxID=167645 RepID=UPI0012920431|nr:CidA/LrgA family protein [Propionivibrio limicola]
MLIGFLQLLAFLLAGEAIVFIAAIPLPAPVVGMALLLGWLLWRSGKTPKPPESLEQATQGILQFLSLLFVPAGVGIILHLERLQREWAAILGPVLFGTLISIGLTALLLNRLAAGKKHD